ncbi:MAG: ChaN family lipoprotein [Bacteroidales bacterium]|nr:ChaN family lipoprotein [Bacteroidales bacterium]
MKNILIAVLVSISSFIMAQETMAYKIYNNKGKEVSFEDVVKSSLKADVLFFGELHNNPISHWMQFELTKALIEKKEGKVKLGAEMFEADNQLVINELLDSLIKEKKFEDDCRLWPNYATDYKPLMHLAMENKLSFIATNVPRRYASVVYYSGFEGLDRLSSEAKKYIAPLPIQYDPEQDAYKSMLTMGGMPGHVNENLPKAQAIKDATMAYFIAQNLKKGELFIHYNGAYHSDKYQGIIYYLKPMIKSKDIITITTVSSSDVSKLREEEKALADFIIVVNENMTTTH